MIDVGANVGETVNLVDLRVPGGHYLCVEPCEKFYRLLYRNTKFVNAMLKKVAVAERVHQEHKRVGIIRGTAALRDSEKPMPVLTIDALLEIYPKFSETNVLKSDTDGYDFKVLRGAERLLDTRHPALFFEFDPQFLKGVGHDDPLAVIPFLNQHGYEHFIFYDNCGYVLTDINGHDQNVMRCLTEYCNKRPFIWMDVAAFPEGTLFHTFFEREMARVPAPERGYEHRYETSHFY
jgi:FkbM family methyltransferase